MKIHYSISLAVAAAVIVLVSVSGQPVQASRVDGKIISSAKKSYVFKTYLKDDAVKIRSKNGAVTLTGTVADDSHSSMAEETVLGLPGVTSVDNQLKITGTSAATGSDIWIAQRVRSTLLLHRSVSYMATNVSVTDGNVVLKGKAASEAQKQLTTEYAQDVSGVKSVDNQMTVNPSPEKPMKTKNEKIDDASITSQVRTSLKYNHGDRASTTKVVTDRGVVTLTGTAKNQAEIDLATKRVKDVHGVKSVVNQMTIDAAQSSTN